MLVGILIGIWLLVVILICMFFKGVKITDTFPEHNEMIFKSPLDERTEFHPNCHCTDLNDGTISDMFLKMATEGGKFKSCHLIAGKPVPKELKKIWERKYPDFFAEKKRKSTRAASDTSVPSTSGTRASKRSSKTGSRSKSRKSK